MNKSLFSDCFLPAFPSNSLVCVVARLYRQLCCSAPMGRPCSRQRRFSLVFGDTDESCGMVRLRWLAIDRRGPSTNTALVCWGMAKEGICHQRGVLARCKSSTSLGITTAATTSSCERLPFRKV